MRSMEDVYNFSINPARDNTEIPPDLFSFCWSSFDDGNLTILLAEECNACFCNLNG